MVRRGQTSDPQHASVREEANQSTLPVDSESLDVWCYDTTSTGQEDIDVSMIKRVSDWLAYSLFDKKAGWISTSETAIEDEPSQPPLCGQAPKTENGLFVQC